MEQGNDYLVGVKGNQPKLMQAIEPVSQQQSPSSGDCQRERSRDRDVERIVSVYDDVSGLTPDWKKPQSLIVVRRCGTRGGQSFDQVSYYLSSLSASALELGLGIRGHRLIENGLHARHAMWCLARTMHRFPPTIWQRTGQLSAILPSTCYVGTATVPLPKPNACSGMISLPFFIS